MLQWKQSVSNNFNCISIMIMIYRSENFLRGCHSASCRMSMQGDQQVQHVFKLRRGSRCIFPFSDAALKMHRNAETHVVNPPKDVCSTVSCAGSV